MAERQTEYGFRLQLIEAMRIAHRMACEAPQIKNGGDAIAAVIAERIVELAEAGEIDPERLCTEALRKLSH
jgi:hypothetical protein